MSFQEKIERFNRMYLLPVATKPSLDQLGISAIQRLRDFKNILLEEIIELDPIIEKLENNLSPEKIQYKELEILTDLADLLGDIQVYCASEMAKFGLPQDQVLEVIMDSNFSKLGADGQPIYDERGKVQKGPGYWKPEPRISQLLVLGVLNPGLREAADLLRDHNRNIGGHP